MISTTGSGCSAIEGENRTLAILEDGPPRDMSHERSVFGRMDRGSSLPQPGQAPVIRTGLVIRTTPGSISPRSRYPAFLYIRWFRALPAPVNSAYVVADAGSSDRGAP